MRKALLQNKKLVGVSPMYRTLALRLGLDYLVVNPYNPGEERTYPGSRRSTF